MIERRKLSTYQMTMWFLIALILATADFSSDQMIASEIQGLEKAMRETNQHICDAIRATKD